MPRPESKRWCDICARRCTKQASGYWLCDPVAGGCGWSDDPSTVQPQAASSEVVEASPASESAAES